MSDATLGGACALITGAGGGIGSATAHLLAQHGADVVALDLDADAAARTVELVEKEGRRALAVETDVTSRASVGEAVGAAVEAFGRVDILVNAAGIGRVAPVVDMDEADWDRVIDVNLKSAFLASQTVLPHMIERSYGRIVNITSRSAYKSRPGTSAYAASKGGMLAFSRVLASEVGPHGITVNNVAPGTTLTPLLGTVYPTAESQRQEAIESGIVIEPRLAAPEEIAGAVLYLCSPASAYTTGTTLHVNGGTYMP